MAIFDGHRLVFEARTDKGEETVCLSTLIQVIRSRPVQESELVSTIYWIFNSAFRNFGENK